MFYCEIEVTKERGREQDGAGGAVRPQGRQDRVSATAGQNSGAKIALQRSSAFGGND